jgi:hypothetical protein
VTLHQIIEKLALGVGIAVDVPLRCLDRPMPSQ